MITQLRLPSALAAHRRELAPALDWHYVQPLTENDLPCPLCGGVVEGAKICGGAACRQCGARWYDGKPEQCNKFTPLPGAAFYLAPRRKPEAGEG